MFCYNKITSLSGRKEMKRFPSKTTEELLKPDHLPCDDLEAKKFFKRVGHVCLGPDVDLDTSPVSEEEAKPIDYAALNKLLDEDDEAFFRECQRQK